MPPRSSPALVLTVGCVLATGCVLAIGCGGSHKMEEVDSVQRVDALGVDPETGLRISGCPEGRDTSVEFSGVEVENGVLTVRGRAVIDGRRGYGFVRFVNGYERTPIPAPPPPPPDGRPYPEDGPPLSADDLAYGTPLYLSGRFVLRAPASEVARDTILIAYECADWIRVPVRSLPTKR